jgi:hypothetical protein
MMWKGQKYGWLLARLSRECEERFRKSAVEHSTTAKKEGRTEQLTHLVCQSGPERAGEDWFRAAASRE